MQRSLILYATTAAVCCLVGSSCRTPRRAVRVGSDSATLLATLNGLSDGDERRSDWTYTLSDCVTSTTSSDIDQSKTDSTVVKFQAAGLKEGIDGCQLKVVAQTLPPSSKGFIAAEPNVVYWGKDFGIAIATDGALVANVNLQREYGVDVSDLPEQSFTLNVPVKFLAKEAGTPITATIACTPPLKDPGTYPAANPLSGSFTFTGKVQQPTDYVCTEIDVHVGGKTNVYRGNFTGDEGKFRAIAGSKVSTKEIALEPVADSGQADSDSIVIDAKAGACKENQVFNTATRQCEDKK